MKILHTSDWHLGKRLDGFSRFNEQIEVMDEICSIASDEEVDCIVIAGDIFDTFNPPVNAVELFYSTVKKLSNYGKRPIVAIAGNHDSPDRIEAPDPLARINGIILLGYPNTCIPTYSIDNGFSITKTDNGFLEIELLNGELLRIISSPFANELRLQKSIENSMDKKIGDLLSQSWDAIAKKYCDDQGINILLSHLLMASDNNSTIEEPENEKPIENISEKIQTKQIPPNMDYVALGHLHRYQEIDADPCPVIYCGSPLAYSFSEAMQKKFVSIVSFKNKENIKIEKKELLAGRKLVRKKFESLDEAQSWLSNNKKTLVELTLQCDEFLKHDDLRLLKSIHDGIITIIPEFNKKDSTGLENNTNSPTNINRPREELFFEYFTHKHGIPPNKDILSIFKEILSVDISPE